MFRRLLAVVVALASLSASAQVGHEMLTNKSGGTLTLGDVVVVDTGNAAAFTTTTSAGNRRAVGVVAEASIDNDEAGLVMSVGSYVSAVKVTGTVAVGDFLRTSTSAGRAASNGSDGLGCFAVATTANASGDGTVEAVLLMPMGQLSSSSDEVITGTWTFNNSPAINTLSVGVDDTTAGLATIYGDSNVQGGRLRVGNPANEDTLRQYWQIEADGEYIRFGDSSDASLAAVNLLGGVYANYFSAGEAGTERGYLYLFEGPGGNTPPYTQIASRNGTDRFLFIEDAGILRIHTAIPTANTDGVRVGAHLGTAETITANWVSTAFPWADNEVADALTITSGTITSSPISGSTGSFTTLAASSTVTLSGETAINNALVVNENGSNVDVRIETDTVSSAVLIDGNGGTGSGKATFGIPVRVSSGLQAGDPTTELIDANGNITIDETQIYVRLDGASNPDNLDGIIGGVTGQFLLVGLTFAGDAVTARHAIAPTGGAAAIILVSSANKTLGITPVMLFNTSYGWLQVDGS